MKTLQFHVGELFNKKPGTSLKVEFEGPVKFDEIEEKSQISGNLTVYKDPELLEIVAQEITMKARIKCQKCLKSFTYTIKIPLIEAKYHFSKPAKITDINDNFLVDKKHHTIDLTELFRQELLLHFPINQVCSESCKGICPKCGQDRNLEPCNCKDEVAENKPLAALKDLIK